MKKRVAMLLATFIFAVQCTASFASGEENINVLDTFIIPPSFEGVGPFQEGLAYVSINGRYGFINGEGKLVISPEYDFVSDFQNERSIVSIDGKYGIIDSKGETVTALEYDSIDTYTDPGMPIYALKDGKYGFIDNNGNTLIPFEYDNVDMIGFNSGLCAVEKDNKHFFIHPDGTVAIENAEIRFAGCFSEKVAPVSNGEKWGLITKEGEVPLGFVFDEIGWSMSEGVIGVVKEGKWALTDGNVMLTDYLYDGIGMRMKEGRITAFLDGKAGCLDQQGQVAIPFEFDSVGNFSEGLATASKDGKTGIIDTAGNTVIPFIYEEAAGFDGGICAVSKNGVWGAIDKTGKQVIPFLYENIFTNPNRLISAKANGAEGLIYNPVSGMEAPDPISEDREIASLLPTQWARQEVREAIRENLVPKELRCGYEQDITRAEFCQLIIQFAQTLYQMDIDSLLAAGGLKPLPGTFTDTYDKDVLAASALGIVTGKELGKFLPDDRITREEAAVMLSRSIDALGGQYNAGESMNFNDNSMFSPWAVDSIYRISSVRGLRGDRPVMQGSNGVFEPDGTYTRQQAFVSIQRLYRALLDYGKIYHN